MATKAKSSFDFKDNATTTTVILLSAGLGVFYGIKKQAGWAKTVGYAFLFTLAGTMAVVLTTNLENKSNG
jgi:hypothetical protein